MRILLYGMQSSGASAICFLLAQKPSCLAFVDIWSMYAAPSLSTVQDVVAKVVTTTSFPLTLHKERFKPDVTFLILRHPVDVLRSMEKKGYANDDGMIEEKLAVLDEVFRKKTDYDGVLYYEDFLFSPRKIIDKIANLGWVIDYDALNLIRSASEIKAANEEACPEIAWRLKYGMGNFSRSFNRADSAAVGKSPTHLDSARRFSPVLLAHYDNIFREGGGDWTNTERSMLSCKLQGIFGALTEDGRIPVTSKVGDFSLHFNGGNGSSVRASEIKLTPKQNGFETVLSLQGLPARPFNRISGYLRVGRSCAGTLGIVRVADKSGRALAAVEHRLMHGDLRNIDLRFEPSDSPVALELTAKDALKSSDEHRGIFFGDLSLDVI